MDKKSSIHKLLLLAARSYKHSANHRASQAEFPYINRTFPSFQNPPRRDVTGSLLATDSRSCVCPEEVYDIGTVVSSVKVAFGIFMCLKAFVGLLQHFLFIDVPNRMQARIEKIVLLHQRCLLSLE